LRFLRKVRRCQCLIVSLPQTPGKCTAIPLKVHCIGAMFLLDRGLSETRLPPTALRSSGILRHKNTAPKLSIRGAAPTSSDYLALWWKEQRLPDGGDNFSPAASFRIRRTAVETRFSKRAGLQIIHYSRLRSSQTATAFLNRPLSLDGIQVFCSRSVRAPASFSYECCVIFC
jgi:hypothetical protein